MKIESIEKIDDTKTRVVFSRDGHSVSKFLWFGGAVKATGCANDLQGKARIFQKAMREADRDIAFKLHGSDFRKHCEFQSNFWQPLTPEELEKLA